ncbi:MAG: hypothetical protein ACK5SX_08295 [Sandaracinobacter sp.]
MQGVDTPENLIVLMVGLGIQGGGFFLGPMSIPLLFAAIWKGCWSLWAAGSVLLLWGVLVYGLTFAPMGEKTSGVMTSIGVAMLSVLLCAAGVRLRQRNRISTD